MTLLLELGELNIQQNHLDYAESCYKEYLKASSKSQLHGLVEEVPALKKFVNLSRNKQFDEECSY